MFCQYCGKQIPDDMKFCLYCGKKVEDLEESADDTGSSQNTGTAQDTEAAQDTGTVQSNQIDLNAILNAVNSAPVSENTEPVSVSAPATAKSSLSAPQPVQTEAPQPVQTAAPAAQKKTKTKVKKQKQQVKPSEGGKKHKSHLWIWLLVIAAILGIAAAAGYFIVLPRTIDVSKYITINLGSGSSEGKAFAMFDETGFKDKILTVNGIDSKAVSDNSAVLTTKQQAIVKAADDLISSIETSIDPETGLSEDDQVTVNATYDKSYLSTVKVILYKTKYQEKVSDFSALTVYDPFENVTVKFEGTSPMMTATIEGEKEDIFDGEYELSKSSNISVGETVTVTYSGSEDIANKEGYTIQSTSKDFQCDVGAKYVDNANDISAATLAKMQAAAVNTINNWKASSALFKKPAYYTNVSSPSYVGTYLLMQKNVDASTSTYNYALVVYSVSIKDFVTDPSFTTKYDDATVYMPIKFVNIMQDESGNQTYQSDDSKLEIIGTDSITSGGAAVDTIEGYVSLDKLVSECMTKNADNYKESGTSGLPAVSATSAATVPSDTVESGASSAVAAVMDHQNHLAPADFYDERNLWLAYDDSKAAA